MVLINMLVRWSRVAKQSERVVGEEEGRRDSHVVCIVDAVCCSADPFAGGIDSCLESIVGCLQHTILRCKKMATIGMMTC